MRDYSEEELARFAAAIEKLSKNTESAVYKFFMRYGVRLTGEMREAALLDAMMALVEKYGDSVLWLNIDWMELGYVSRAKDNPSAVLLRNAATEALAAADAPNRSKMAEFVGRACRYASTSKAARAAAGRQVAAYAAAEAKRRGYDLITDTIVRADATAAEMGMSPLGLMVIWRPSSATPCAFCTMLASNSWRVASKASLSQYKEHIHPHCSCTLVFKPPDAAMGGITPKKYLDRMNSVIETDADGAEYVMTSDGRRINHYRADGKVSDGYWDEVTNALRRKDYQNPETRDLLREQHREQYARTHPEEDE